MSDNLVLRWKGFLIFLFLLAMVSAGTYAVWTDAGKAERFLGLLAKVPWGRVAPLVGTSLLLLGAGFCIYKALTLMDLEDHKKAPFQYFTQSYGLSGEHKVVISPPLSFGAMAICCILAAIIVIAAAGATTPTPDPTRKDQAAGPIVIQSNQPTPAAP